MIALNLPAYSPLLRSNTEGRTEIFDPLRRRYITLTPEEWVRQHFCNYLTHHLHYPAALLANEVSLSVGGAARRCDTVLYRREDITPRMIVEYKAPTVAITEHVFTQIQSYNSVLRADYLIVSNGLQHYCCRIDYENRRAEFLRDIPPYDQLV